MSGRAGERPRHARRVGRESWHFALGTAALGVLAFDPHHPEVAVIALWNVGAQIGS